MSSLCCRRSMMGMLLAGTTLALAGCGSEAAVVAEAPQAKPQMLVYRDANCGCCGRWAKQAEDAGYPVQVVMSDEMGAVKVRYGVPADMASCHTVLVGGYVVEGHVPFAHIEKLLKDQPKDIIGIAVPGMPRGSPGMEMPDGTVDEFDVMGFGRDGQSRVFSL